MTDLADKIERLDKAATQGPWYTLDPPWLPSGSETSILARSPDPHVARFICDFDIWALDDEEDADRKSENPDADADLIVTLRNAVPEILAALRAEVPKQRPWCETCGKTVSEVLCPTCAKWWHDNPPPTEVPGDVAGLVERLREGTFPIGEPDPLCAEAADTLTVQAQRGVGSRERAIAEDASDDSEQLQHCRQPL